MKKLILVFGVLMVTGLCANTPDVYTQGGIPRGPKYSTKPSTPKPSAGQAEKTVGASAQPATGAEVQQIYIGF